MSVMGDMQALKMRMIVMMMVTTTMMTTTMMMTTMMMVITTMMMVTTMMVTTMRRRQMTGNMQALVMELKNLVEQCLASERAVQVGLCGWERREC